MGMERLYICLLGQFSVFFAEQEPVHFSSRRAELFVAYLAMNPQFHSRESLATLLWDDREQKQAMANLRSLLAQLPKGLRPYLLTTRQTIALNPDAPVTLDTTQLQEAMDAWQQEYGGIDDDSLNLDEAGVDRLEGMLGQYRGLFLSGAMLADSRGLEEWIVLLRERWQRQLILIHFRLAVYDLNHRFYEKGIVHAQFLVQQEPLRELYCGVLMRLYAGDGQIKTAVLAYERCAAALSDELGVEPIAELRLLHKRLQRAQVSIPHLLPEQKPPVLGHEKEIALLHQRLDDPRCHLLTLLGAGELTTNIAIAVAHKRQGVYLDGIVFVALGGVDTAVSMLATSAQTLQLTLKNEEKVASQLCAYLQDREILFIFDTFAHLAEEGVSFVQQLIQNCPDVTVMVTSEEQLFLQAEWIVTVA